MADQSDVENTLVELVSASLYPSGTDAQSVCGNVCRVYRGWPNAAALDTDLAAGRINVTVFPVAGMVRNTTRYPQDWTVEGSTVASLTVAYSGIAATFGGTADAGQLAGLFVDGRTYVYRTQTGDTPALVAANLASLARADSIVHLSGATVSIPGAAMVFARTVADADVVMEVRRQKQEFRITCWCPDPASRDTAASAIDLALAVLRFIDLADGSQGRLIYAGTTVFDQAQDAALYRRDLLYSVEYATTQSAIQPAMLFGSGLLNTQTFTG